MIRSVYSSLRARPVAVIAGLAVFATTARLVALYAIGPLQHPPLFDEGAYFTAAALWVRGFVPHRAFILVHPPGATYVLAPFSLIGAPSVAFVVARTAMTFIGGINALLIGVIARRFVPLWAACAGVLVYAVLPEAVLADQRIVIEPLLNLACLLVVFVWLRPVPGDDERGLNRRAVITGVLVGVAMLFKFWAVFLVVPLIATSSSGRRLRDGVRVAGSSAVCWSLLSMPLAVRAPSAFVRQVILFQADRQDGINGSFIDRFFRIFANPTDLPSGRLVIETVVVGMAGVALVSARRSLSRDATFCLAWLTMILVAFLLAPLHFPQYNSHLAPAVGLVAAWLVTVGFSPVGGPGGVQRAFGWVVVVTLLLAGLQGSASAARNAASGNDDGVRIGEIVRNLPPCVYSFEPAWLIMGDRWADPDLVGVAATDFYVSGLIAASDSGRGDELFAAPAAERALREAVESCPTVIVGPRGHEALATQLDWFEANYHRIAATGPHGPDVWRRNS